jgi:hypothetical protein
MQVHVALVVTCLNFCILYQLCVDKQGTRISFLCAHCVYFWTLSNITLLLSLPDWLCVCVCVWTYCYYMLHNLTIFHLIKMLPWQRKWNIISVLVNLQCWMMTLGNKCESLLQSPWTSLEKLANQRRSSCESVYKTMKILKFHCHCTHNMHELKKSGKGQWFWNFIQDGVTNLYKDYFTDMDWCHTSGYVNSQNNRVWSARDTCTFHEQPIITWLLSLGIFNI